MVKYVDCGSPKHKRVYNGRSSSQKGLKTLIQRTNFLKTGSFIVSKTIVRTEGRDF